MAALSGDGAGAGSRPCVHVRAVASPQPAGPDRRRLLVVGERRWSSLTFLGDGERDV